MDLFCQKCGEPQELDHVMYELPIIERRMFLQGLECDSCLGKMPEGGRPEIALKMKAAMELLWPDIDGVPATLAVE